MPWKPLPDDIPLDHEVLQPPQQPMGAGDARVNSPGEASLEPLPADAKLDLPEEPPIIITGVHAPKSSDIKPQEVDPSRTEQGFSEEVAPDAVYHASLSDEDKAEYAKFFTDPKNPPSPEHLRQWVHQKTGAYMTNADEIVERFRTDGQFSTNQQMIVPTEKHGSVESYLGHTTNAAFGDYGAEAVAPLDALGLGGSDRPNVWNTDDSFSSLVGQNADLERAQFDRDAADHPIASGLGEAAGVAATVPVGGAVADAARLGKLGELGRTAVQGTVEGGIYGSGAAGPGHRVEGGAFGATTVPIIGAVAKLPVAGYRGVQSVLAGSPNLARKIIAKTIKSDLNTPESVGADIAAAHANDVPMALADTGENARGLLAATSRTSGVSRTIARDALEERQGGLAGRVTSAIERDLGPVSNPHELADTLMTEARDKAGPLYDRAYSALVPDAFVEKIKPLLQRPSVQKALGNARRIAQEEGDDPAALGLVIGSDGQTIVGAAPSWKTLDYIKRGMDDVVETYRDTTTGRLALNTEGRAVNNTLRSYLGALDAANPDYAAARAAYGGPVRGIDAMNQGRKALSMTADDLEAKMRDMTPFEKTMFATGTRRAMAELVASKGDSADVVHALVGTGKKRAMLARLFGDRKTFQRFVDTLGQEREGFRTFKQALTGSPTAANLADDSTLEAATTAAELIAHGGLPVATAVRKSIKFLGREISEKAKQQIAAMLSDTNPARIRELAAELRAQADKRRLRIRKVSAATNAVGKGVVVLQPRTQ